MANLTSFELFKIRFLGVLYALAYYTAHRSFFGARWSSWLKWTILLVTVVAWFTRWPIYWAVLGAICFFAVQFLYWSVKRQGYVRFLAAPEQPHQEGEDLLKDNKKMKTLATGIFSVSSHEAYVLQRPAEYWRVPIGDHAIMVEHQPGRYLYQFVQAGALQSVEVGYLIFGRRPQKTLAITFLTTWGPESAQFTPKQFMTSTNHTPAKLERTIYLTFEDIADRHLVRRNLLRDVGKPLHKPMISD
jgi:hypothetical protein